MNAGPCAGIFLVLTVLFTWLAAMANNKVKHSSGLDGTLSSSVDMKTFFALLAVICGLATVVIGVMAALKL